jgi:hypothetical protein
MRTPLHQTMFGDGSWARMDTCRLHKIVINAVHARFWWREKHSSSERPCSEGRGARGLKKPCCWMDAMLG